MSWNEENLSNIKRIVGYDHSMSKEGSAANWYWDNWLQRYTIVIIMYKKVCRKKIMYKKVTMHAFPIQMQEVSVLLPFCKVFLKTFGGQLCDELYMLSCTECGKL